MKTPFRLFKLLGNEVQSGLFFFSFFKRRKEGRERERKETEILKKKKKESKTGYGCSLPKHNFNFL